jgi:transposase
MISLPAGTNIWIAAGITDLRRGFTGLSAVAQTVLEQDPYSGHDGYFDQRPIEPFQDLVHGAGDGFACKSAAAKRPEVSAPSRRCSPSCLTSISARWW